MIPKFIENIIMKLIKQLEKQENEFYALAHRT